MTDPLQPFREWLNFLDSHEGRLHRRSKGGLDNDSDLAALIPTPPGQTIFTVGDLRKMLMIVHRLEAENARLREACIKQNYEVEQSLGPVLYGISAEGLPLWGDHVGETLAMEAGRILQRLKDKGVSLHEQ